MSESDKPQLRQITREDIEFLAALQDEMNTQPHQCQADPRFWVVLTHEYREAKEHIKRNDYHYIDPHTYGMTAWRSPQVEQLYKILHEVDFKRLLEVSNDEG